jgi:glycerol-3-phosphate dehydrogenase
MLHIHGYLTDSESLGSLQVYGSDAEAIRALAKDPDLAMQLHPALPYIAAEVVWATHSEMARTVEDVLARHTRALFLNAAAAEAMADPVAKLIAKELNRDQAWIDAQLAEFHALAAQYRVV